MRADDPPLSKVDERYDVVVVGLGAAGACAAIVAAERGSSVLVLDRFYGGGSTEQSGGVVYAGGGTAQQAEAGVTDTPEETVKYLKRETGGAVSEATLRRFAESGPEMIEWLQRQGVEFEGSLCPYKTSYPTNRHYLYYSGNELATGYKDVATPAPRGHRTRAKNFSGATFYSRLRDAVLRAGVTVQPLAEVRRLLVEDDVVVGVEYDAPPIGREPGTWHKKFTKLATKAQTYYPPVGSKLNRFAVSVQRRRSTAHVVRARHGVVLATGGFGFDRELVREHAPKWANVKPLGTIGDDGAALRLGEQVDARRGHLDKVSGWRFISPPSPFMEGIVVDGSGDRFANEQLYGATLSKPLFEEHGGRALLVLDAGTWRRARRAAPGQAAFFHAAQLLWIFSRGHTKAATLEALADKIGVSASGLRATVDRYNAGIDAQQPDEFGKTGEFYRPLRGGPFYAVDCSPNVSAFYPCAAITLGGLVVDEDTGSVVRGNATPVTGLYAAGRSAVGLCSNSYVSGLALADAVFSGRRAGAHASDPHPSLDRQESA